MRQTRKKRTRLENVGDILSGVLLKTRGKGGKHSFYKKATALLVAFMLLFQYANYAGIVSVSAENELDNAPIIVDVDGNNNDDATPVDEKDGEPEGDGENVVSEDDATEPGEDVPSANEDESSDKVVPFNLNQEDSLITISEIGFIVAGDAEWDDISGSYSKIVAEKNDKLVALYKDGDTFATDHTVDVSGDFALGFKLTINNDSIPAGTKVDIKIPDKFKFNGTLTDKLSFNNEELGSYVLTNNILTVTFNEIKNRNSVVAEVFVGTSFSEITKEGDLVQEFEIPFGDKQSFKFKIPFESTFTPGPKGITKDGKAMRGANQSDTNSDSVNWVIVVNNALEKLSNVTLIDNIPAGLTLDNNSIRVVKYPTTIKGPDKSKPETVDLTNRVSVEGQKLSISLGDIDSAYEISFKTSISETGVNYPANFVNNAQLTHDGTGSPYTDSKTITVKKGESLSKSTYGHDDKNQTVVWGINFNMDSQIFDKDVTLVDTLSKELKLVYDGSPEKAFTIHEIKQNGNDSSGINWIQTGAPLTSGFTAQETTPSQNGFKLTLDKSLFDEGKAYRITYTTKVDENTYPVFENIKVSNSVKIDGSSDAGKSADSYFNPQMITGKKVLGSDYTYQQKVKWEIKLNQNAYNVQGGVLKDTFTNQGLKLVPNSFKIYTDSTKKTEFTAYQLTTTLNEKGNQESGFEVKFPSAITTELFIEYETYFDYIKYGHTSYSSGNWQQKQNNPNDTNNKSFNNKAVFSWEKLNNKDDTGGKQQKEANFTPNLKTYQNNGVKTGKYDAIKKEITWNVSFNYHLRDLDSGTTFTDTLENNQILDESSFEVYRANIKADGTIDLNSKREITSHDWDYDQDKKIISAELNDKIVKQIIIFEFKTKIDGSILDNTAAINNFATLIEAGTPKHSTTVTGSVDIPFKSGHAVKSGKYNENEGKVTWTVEVNRDSFTINNFNLTDILGENQILLTDTVKLYKGELKAKQNDTGYEVSYDESQSSKDLKIVFSKTKTEHFEDTISLRAVSINAPYKLVYDVIVDRSVIKKGGYIDNSLEVTGLGIEFKYDKEKSKVQIEKSRSGGNVTGYNQKVTIVKYSSDYEGDDLSKIPDKYLLAGAEFRLLSKNNEVIRGKEFQESYFPDGTSKENYTTDDQGNLVIKELVWGEYELEEIVAPKDHKKVEDKIKILVNKDGVFLVEGTELKAAPTIYVANDYINGEIGDYVWLDLTTDNNSSKNADGIQDHDLKEGINGIKVNLLSKNSAGEFVEINSQQTRTENNKKGYYLFNELPKGEYKVEFEVPVEYKLTKSGLKEANRVGVDSNYVTAVTGTGGNPLISKYQTEIVTINNQIGWEDHTIDLGLVYQGKIGDRVWYDVNNDGIQDREIKDGKVVFTEPGLKGVEVILYEIKGTTENVVAKTTTDENGNYLFNYLPEGNYKVQFKLPDGYVKTKEKGTDLTEWDSNPTDENLTTTNIIPIGPNKWEDLTIDLGVIGKGKIGDYVWYDDNNDGIQNDGDQNGLNGMIVKLYKGGKEKEHYVTETVTKDKDGKPGYYLFDHLTAGDYYVEFVKHDNFDRAKQGVGTDHEKDSNKVDENGITNVIKLGDGIWEDLSIDHGYISVGEIGNYVWHDRNRDGKQNEPAFGINGVEVILLRELNGETKEFAKTTTKDKDGQPGYYLFEKLPYGKYQVQFNYPEEYDLTTPHTVDNKADDGSITINEERKTVKFDITEENPSNHKIDLGLVAKGKIGNYVWLDRNRDGIQNEEAKDGLNGIIVNLFRADNNGKPVGDVFATTVTKDDASNKPGYYLFDNLARGSYVVQFKLPDSYQVTEHSQQIEQELIEQGRTADDYDSNETDANGFTKATELGPNAPKKWEDLTIDLGVVGKGKIGDYVWFDDNNDGIQNDGDHNGLNSITVKLYKGGKTPNHLVETTLTKNDKNGKPGYYLFEHLTEGDYYVEFVKKDIYDRAQPTAGNDRGKDSNKVDENGITDVIKIGPANWTDLTIDHGFIGVGSIGDYVWHDRDRDGKQNEKPEHGINDVTVTLYREVNGEKVKYGESIKTKNDANGNPGYYLFDKLPYGTYFVKFEYPEEYSLTTPNTKDNEDGRGSITIDEKNTTGKIVISNENKMNDKIDLGLVAKGEIGNYVWQDRNRDGLQNEKASEGLNDITVNLFRADKDGKPVGSAYATTKTTNDASGNPGYYLFDNLARGSYVVQFEVPADYEVTKHSQVIDSKLIEAGRTADDYDSNELDAQGFTKATTLGPDAPKGWKDHTIDLGVVAIGEIGDYVWLDENRNGKQDEDEKYGFNNITVRLYDKDKKMIGETVTADKDGKPGYYLFDQLTRGTYYVQFISPNGYFLTPFHADGTDATNDSNAIDRDGFTTAIVIGLERTNEGNKVVWQDHTIDLGIQRYDYVPPTPVDPTVPTNPTQPTVTPGPGVTPNPEPTPGPVSPEPTEPGTPLEPGETPGTKPSPTPPTVKEETPVDVPKEGEVDVPEKGTTPPTVGETPNNGKVTVTPDGKWTYTPNPGFVGKDKFSIIVTDEDGNEEEIFFEIDVDDVPLGTGTDQGNTQLPGGVNKLPKTGQYNTLLVQLFGLALILTGAAVLAIRRKRDSNKA